MSQLRFLWILMLSTFFPSMFDMFTMLNLLGPSVTDVFEIIARRNLVAGQFGKSFCCRTNWTAEPPGLQQNRWESDKDWQNIFRASPDLPRDNFFIILVGSFSKSNAEQAPHEIGNIYQLILSGKPINSPRRQFEFKI